ncbi:MAG: GNAT family N-acetyltransferase [Bacteroidota bacterium]
MKLFKYNIILERLKEADIELVRQWRNSDLVRLNMEYRDIISPEQQLEWFRSIDNLKNNYLMIHYKGEKIGLLNDKNVNWDSRTSESGLFLGRTEYYATFIPYLVSVAGIETTFYYLDWNRQFAHILKSNQNAIKYNLQLGYHLSKGQDTFENQQYEMTRESFERSAGNIRKAVRLLAGPDLKMKLLLEPADYESGLAQKFEGLFSTHLDRLEHIATSEGSWYNEL